MGDKPRIVIDEDELRDGPTDGTAPSAAAGNHEVRSPGGGLPPLAPSRPVTPSGLPQPSQPATGSGILHDPRWSVLIAAAAGIALGWAIAEIFDIYESLVESALRNAESEAEFKRGLNIAGGVWIGVVGSAFGLAYLTFDRIVEGAWEEVARRAVKAALPVFIACFASGYLAQMIYVEMASDGEPGSGGAYVARMIGWAIFGGGIGLAIGLVDRSKQRAINGALGGLGGGAVGGLVFEWITGEELFGVSTGRLVSLLAVGLAIAYAIRLVETARREAWLSIVSGGMAGKEFIVYHDVTRIGASPECEIFLLKDSAIQEQHARIIDRDGRRTLIALGPVSVGQTPVQEHILRSGDQIRIGNTVISYSERALAPTSS